VTDDEHRENEGDLVMAASKATTETINMMIRYCSGVICVPCTEPHLRRLGLNPMVPHNRESYRTDYTVSVDAAEGITTGISAYDRTRTIQLLADDATSADQLVQPGHVFPLRARPGGVLERAGHTEAAVDLAVLAGLHPSGVICEVVNEDGSMARVPELLAFKKTHDLKLISIAALIEYRHKRDRLVARVGTAPLKTEHGDFTVHLFRSVLDGRQHYVLTLGEIGPEPTLVRVHSENLIADAFHGLGIGSYQALHASMRRVAAEGCGVILYISQPNGGIDLADTLGTGQPKDGPAPQERGGPAPPDRPHPTQGRRPGRLRPRNRRTDQGLIHLQPSLPS
jgi:3,4-dihydroxy 2-butanone 4-phosphate synthase/GTP cyclohydrolase II